MHFNLPLCIQGNKIEREREREAKQCTEEFVECIEYDN